MKFLNPSDLTMEGDYHVSFWLPDHEIADERYKTYRIRVDSTITEEEACKEFIRGVAAKKLNVRETDRVKVTEIFVHLWESWQPLLYWEPKGSLYAWPPPPF